MKFFIGSPLSGEEADFLRLLARDLAGLDAVVLANFVVGDQQIDFLVVTMSAAAHLEHKSWGRPFFGGMNGDWAYTTPAGTRSPAKNAYRQALGQKYALSDSMLAFQQAGGVPSSAGSRYYTTFESCVCVYPEIAQGSIVTLGDKKVRVRSYRDVLGAIRTGKMSQVWTLSDWERFAQQHLHLRSATLEEAVDPCVIAANEKLHGYTDRLRNVLSTGLGSLTEGDQGYGIPLLQRLRAEQNFLVVGPSGAGKTHHLHHLAIELATSDRELPIVADAKRFRGGDFAKFLRQAIAPFYVGQVDDLLGAARDAGLRPALLLDDLSGCLEACLPDLLRGAQTFVLHTGGRVVCASQRAIELPADLHAQTMVMRLPKRSEKREIYAFHAKISASPELDPYCEHFDNAYDLAVAGQSHRFGPPPRSRAELYQRYVQRCLPQSHSTVATSLLCHLAADMAENLTFVLERDRFEAMAEDFLKTCGAPLAIVDELLRSRLLRHSPTLVVFEHEMLLRYFQALNLRRTIDDITALSGELGKPRNSGLLEFVLPSLSRPRDIASMLKTSLDPTTLSRVCAGLTGPAAQAVLLEECEDLIRRALADLPHITVNLDIGRLEDGRRQIADIQLIGGSTWSQRDAAVAATVARNLDQVSLQAGFLRLLDATEWRLRTAVHAAAKKDGVSSANAWSLAVWRYGGTVQGPKMNLPFHEIASELRSVLMHAFDNVKLPLRDELLARVRRDLPSHFALGLLLEDRQSAAEPERSFDENLQLLQAAWDSKIYALQLGATFYAEMMRPSVDGDTERSERIRSLLSSFESSNLFLSSAVVEALARFDGFEPPVSEAEALAEMRVLIAPGAASDPKLREVADVFERTPTSVLAARAYGCISGIFEDVFGASYSNAYYALDDNEKRLLLHLATRHKDGFQLGWILGELSKVADDSSLPVFEEFASTPRGDRAFYHDRVEAFAHALEGSARLSETPPPYLGGNAPEDYAWRVIGEILFRYHRGEANAQRVAQLWASLTGDALAAAGDVLYELRSLDSWRSDEGSVDLARLWPAEYRRAAEACLTYQGQVPIIAPWDHSRERATFLITKLSEIGDERSIDVLRRLVDDAVLGQAALKAIVALDARRVGIVSG